MTTIYYLIVAKGSISLASDFFAVYLPNSPQGERDKLYLQTWAAETMNYWNIRNHESQEFIYKISQSLNVNLALMQITAIQARSLVKFIMAYHCVPKCREISHESAKIRKFFCPKSANIGQKKVIRKAEAKERNKPKSMVC